MLINSEPVVLHTDSCNSTVTWTVLDGSYDLGWRRFVNRLDVRPIDGDHLSILRPPHVGEVARQLAELLDGLGPCGQPTHEKPQAAGTPTHLADNRNGPAD